MAEFSLCQSEYLGFLPKISDGTAKLKPECLVPKPTAEVKPTTDEKSEENGAAAEKGKGERKRGQNRKRPRPDSLPVSTRLCPAIVLKHGDCTYGEKCRFMHDISAYMKIKVPDISDQCPIFDKFGVCRNSFSCRYASAHVKFSDEEGYVNVECPDGKDMEPVIINQIPRELQMCLRTRKYQFPNSECVLKKLDAIHKERKALSVEYAIEISKGQNENIPVLRMEDIKVDLSREEKINIIKKNKFMGPLLDDDTIKLREPEKKKIDFKYKTYLAPLTTCGNLPFRVVCKRQGVDITCGEMAMCTNLLQGSTAEWALLKRHPIEDCFGVQVCGGYPDTMTRCAELLNETCDIDFIDINMGCPIDLVYKKGSGSALMRRSNKLFDIVSSMKSVMDIPLTVKMRTGLDSKRNIAHTLLPRLHGIGVALTTIHGRSREARYTKIADWAYLDQCAKYADPMPVFGNGDILTYDDYKSVTENTAVSGVMIARGALIKPWIFTEIKEQRTWDISSSERFDILKEFVDEGLLHWGSDAKGVENTRRFLLEWLSFLYRYIPVGLLEQTPQRINERPAPYVGRNDLETLLSSNNCNDWVKISEMLLGKVPDSFSFLPKHKANSYN